MVDSEDQVGEEEEEVVVVVVQVTMERSRVEMVSEEERVELNWLQLCKGWWGL